MGWNPYTDQKNRAYSNILTTLFPEQTKTIPRIIVWSIIFMIDLIVGVVGAMHFGILQPERFNNSNALMVGAGILILVIIGVFWLQGVIWFGIVKAIKKRNQLD